MYTAFAPMVGAVITVMNGINSRLAAAVGILLAALVIHLVGLAAISVLSLIRREEGSRERLPFYYYLGGCIGVGTVFTSTYAFNALGAAMAVALALLGQTLFSVFADAVGFLGRERYPLTPRRLPGIALAALGVLVMAGKGRAEPFAMLVALASGAIPGLSFILNAELGRKKGIVRSTRFNYLTGLGTTAAIILLFRPAFRPALSVLASINPLFICGGGLLGVVVVASMNAVFLRMPAFSATLLIFVGQALAGVLIDLVADGKFDLRKLLGTILVIGGLALNNLLSRKDKEGGPSGSTSRRESVDRAADLSCSESRDSR